LAHYLTPTMMESNTVADPRSVGVDERMLLLFFSTTVTTNNKRQTPNNNQPWRRVGPFEVEV
jgi:hypothetical protein